MSEHILWETINEQKQKIADLEQENRLLGERCNQLLKDKGDLTDQIADIKANCDLAIEGRDIKIKELEIQIKKMKCCGNCNHFDKHYNCELTRLTLKSCLCNAFDKWELRR